MATITRTQAERWRGREGRGRFRLWLSVTMVGLVAGTLPFLSAPAWAGPRAFAFLGAGILLAAATLLVPALSGFWDRFGGIVWLVVITALAVLTGGADSPYTVLYLISMLYGTVFFERGRLLFEALALVACVTFLLVYSGTVGAAPIMQAALRLGVLLVMAAVVHGLVTRLRAITRRLEASEQRYRSLVEYNPDAVHSMTLDGRITSANPAAAKMSGYTPDELKAMRLLPLQAVIAPDVIPETMRYFRETARGEPQHFHTAIRNRTGERVELETATVPIVIDGKIVGVFSVSKDVTDQQRAERLLREHAAQQAAVARLGQQALAVDDLPALLDEAVRLVGATLDVPLCAVVERSGRDQVVVRAGSGWHPGVVGRAVVVEPDDVFGAAAGMPGALVTGDFVTEARCRPGSLLSEHGVASGVTAPIGPPGLRFGHLCVFAREPREFGEEAVVFLETVANVLASAISRRQAEDQLLQVQKLQAVGQLAGGIAHDFNNLLTALLGYCELLEPAVRHDAVAAGRLDEALGVGERARALVDQLLTFSRGRMTTPSVADLNATVTGMGTLLQGLAGEQVTVRTELAADGVLVRADPSQLEQVVLNLAVNARDAMPGGGVLTIGTAEVRLDDAEAEVLGVPPGRYVCLSVADTGTGIDPDAEGRLFEPFFTTKQTGTGLGLSTVYGIVTGAGGQVRVESRAGAGARFSVYLPRNDGPVARRDGLAAGGDGRAAGDSAHAGEAARGPEATILVVEDQAAVRSLVCEILGQHGYRVLQAANGAEALRVAESHPEVDLVLTDVVMPELGGPQLAELLHERRPDIRVLYMSGYSGESELLRRHADDDTAFLPKPFGVSELLETVEALLARTGPIGAA